MRRKLFLLVLIGIPFLVGSGFWFARPLPAKPLEPAENPARAPRASLPVTQVILFNSGVGYFQREGEIDGNARIDFAFPASDVNDLLKSLVLEDKGNGNVSSISYDSQDPIEKTLKSFALDLTSNPSFGQILNQARGERIEVNIIEAGAPRPTTLTGAIVGMETQSQHVKDSAVEVQYLNLLTAEGMRSVPLAKIDRVRFLNPVLESEFLRALAVLGATHDMQKKTISLNFSGQGKRKVRVGYVVENPIWKTSYRLVIGGEGKPHLQGWAVLENSTDEDWKDIRMLLVSGRPISYQMNLYQPLYIPRPTVEPELFASLRPPAYNGTLATPGNAANPVFPAGVGQAAANRYQSGVAVTGTGITQTTGTNPVVVNPIMINDTNRLSYEELQKRRQGKIQDQEKARALGQALATSDSQSSVASLAAAEEIGDAFHYTIAQKVSLNRQKSALLPIINKDVEATKVSIFNEAVHAKFPLLGLKFKNLSGQNLMQGPITIYEGENYAGDGRVMDLQPNEERLISYAVDLGTEVKAEGKSHPSELTAVKVGKGLLYTTNKQRQTRSYVIKNRSPQDRVLVIEHPYRADWKLVVTDKSSTERSRDVYRFEVLVKAGASLKHDVVEEQMRAQDIELATADDKFLNKLLASKIPTQAVKDAITKAMEFRTRLATTQSDLAHAEQQLKEIVEDQTRLRANLKEMPATSAAYRRYLEKFDTQETEIEKLRSQTKQFRETEKQQKTGYDTYLANLSIE